MKSERRHELEHNALADWLAQALKTIEPYSKPVMLGLVVVLLLFALWNWWGSFSAQGTAKAWDSFNTAVAVEDALALDELAENNPNKSVGQMAALAAADMRLDKAARELYVNRANATSDLTKAAEGYTAVIDNSRDSGLRERALIGRARAFECLAGTRHGEGELDKAIADYQRIVDTYPNGPFGEFAKRRVEALKSTDAKTFYDRFAAYTPPAPGKKDSPFGQSPLSELGNLGDLGPIAPAKTEPGNEAPKSEPGKLEPATKEAVPAKAETPKPDAAKTAPAAPQPPKAETPKK